MLLEGYEMPAALHWELHVCKKVALIWKKTPCTSFTGMLNPNNCLCAEPKCKQRLRYHGAETLQKAPGSSGHSSWHLPTPSSYTKQVGLPIFSGPQGAADSDQVCNTPETTQWAGSRLNRYLHSPTVMHECARLSLALDTLLDASARLLAGPREAVSLQRELLQVV